MSSVKADPTCIEPLGDRAVVRKLEDADKTAGGLFIPDTAKSKKDIGYVVAVGPGKRLDDGSHRPMPVKVGDKVLVHKFAGNEISIGGEELLVVREDEILAILRDSQCPS